MGAREALKLVFGSTVVSVVMAACASSVRSPVARFEGFVEATQARSRDAGFDGDDQGGGDGDLAPDVRGDDGTRAGTAVEVVLASGLRIQVRPGFDSATLARLLDVLEDWRP